MDVPAALLHNLKHNKVLHEKNIILTVLTEEVPRLRDEGRVTTERLSERFARVTVRFGFMEGPDVPRALRAANFDLEEASFFLSRRALQPSSEFWVAALAGLHLHSARTGRKRRVGPVLHPGGSRG